MVIVYLPGFLACVILFLLAFRGYKKYIAPYTVFGPCFVALECIWTFILGRLPRNIPRSCYAFQLIVKACKKNMSEGFCVLWIPLAYVIVYNEEAVKILSNSQAALSKAGKYHILADLLGSGLVTSHSKLWRKRRKMFQPAFQVSMFKYHVSTFNKNAANLVERLLKMTNEPIKIIDPLKKSSFDNLLMTVFGMSLDTPKEKEEQEELIHLFDLLGNIGTERILNPLLQPKLVLPLFSSGRKFLGGVKEAKSIADRILLRVKNSALEKKGENSDQEENEEYYGKTVRKSFAEILVQAHIRDPSFTMQDMHDEIITILTAGYDTVAYALMWTLFLLGNHKDVQDEVYNEVEHLMGSDISYEDAQSLTYTECVIKESLRLYPAVPMYARRLEEDVQCGKYKLPKGTNFIFLPYMLHRNPNIYPNPEKFDPERFKDSADRNPWSFTPFSEGIRSCIGKKYAMLQMKITLAYILQNFKVTSLQRVEDIEVGWEIVLAPSEPIRLMLTPRRHISQQG